MKKTDTDLDRLLRSAAGAGEQSTPEVPYGFETRVIARWRSGEGRADETLELTRFLRRIDALALAVLVLASVSGYRLLTENEARTTPQNEYAIADSAIQTEFSQ